MLIKPIMKLIEDAKIHGFQCLEWNGAHHKARWQCSKDHIFEKRASLLKHSGYSCPECWKIRNRTKEGFKSQSGGLSKQLSSDPIQEFEKAGYKVVGQYVRSKDNVELICPNGHSCRISRSNFLNGFRCKVCKFEKQSIDSHHKTYSKYKKIIEDKGYKLLTSWEEYDGYDSILDLERPDGTVLQTRVVNIINNGNHFDPMIRYEEDRIHRLSQIQERVDGGFSIVDPEEFRNQNSVVTFRCDKGHEFKKRVTRFRSNYCPYCKLPATEKHWTRWLEIRGIKYILHYRDLGFEIDIYLPDHKIGLELCGLAFHSENNIFRGNRANRNRHIEKRKKCDDNSIRLFTIYENENDSPITESIISNALMLSKRKFARNLLPRNVSNSEATGFFNANHLMGGITAKCLGLYEDDTLLCAFSYKKIGDHIEISRFATLLNHTVVGGFSRLLKEAIRQSGVKNVISYLDLRYSSGISYEKTGFTKTGETLGWKWTDFRTTYNRLQCRANMDERRMSEKEYAEELGWYKIYDCGQAKYELFL